MNKKTRAYTLTFLGSLTILLLFSLSMGLFPFTDKVLFSGDLASQYIPFANLYKQFFHDPSQMIYSFMNGIGSNTLSLVSYYLTSPFNLILLFFPTRDLTIGMMVVIYTKIIVSSLTMTYYLGSRKQLWNGWNMILSLSFSFCGFATVYCYNVMWLDVMVWLPLIIGGLERYIDENRPALFQWSLFFLFISNYYMAYMVSLFLAMYFIYWVIRHHHAPWKKWIQRFFAFVGRSLILVMIAGVIYVPTLIGMLNTDKSSFDVQQFIKPLTQFGLFGLSGLGIGASQYEWRLEHVPILYTGLLVLILTVAYFLNQHISKRQRWIDFGFITILFLCLWLTPLTMIFQMFQPTAGFPFRFTYLISFMMVVLASEEVRQFSNQRPKIILSSALIILLFSLCLLTFYCDKAKYQIVPANLWLSIGMVILLTLGLSCYLTQHWWKYVLCGLSLLDLTVNFYFISQNIGTISQRNYAQYIEKYQQALPPQKGIERLDNLDVIASEWGMNTVGYNDGALLGFNGVNGYTSSLENNSLKLDYSLGLYSWNERRISNIGATPLTQFVLNVTKGLATHHQQFKVKDEAGKGAIIPLAKKLPTMGSQLFANQNKVSQSLWGVNVFHPVAVRLLSSAPHQVSYRLTAPTSGLLYVQIPHKVGYSDQYQIFVNGKRQTFGTEIKAKTLLPIKKLAANQSVEVTLKTKHDNLQKDVFQWQLFDTETFQQKRNRTPTATLERKGLTLTGEIDSPTSNVLLSIPYDSQWQALVNGKKVRLEKNSLSLMTLPVTKGKNTIELIYRPLSLYLGLVVSLIGLFLEGLLLIYRHKK